MLTFCYINFIDFARRVRNSNVLLTNDTIRLYYSTLWNYFLEYYRIEAEGEATARIRKAEAEAIAIAKITEAVGKSTNPANYLLAQKYIQMLNEVAQGDKTKTVFLPYEATNLMGSIGGIKELFKGE